MTHTSDKHFTDEELELVARGKEDGMYMKAPNGSPTSLDERQWVQVRTRAFKNWFGDWENAPEAASRIVDDIRFRQVYHGSPASFGHFDHAFTGTGEGMASQAICSLVGLMDYAGSDRDALSGCSGCTNCRK